MTQDNTKNNGYGSYGNSGTGYGPNVSAHGGYEGTRMYASRKKSDNGETEKKGKGRGRPKTDPKMAEKGKAKYGEARKAANERRKSVLRRRWFKFALAVTILVLLMMFMVYKLIFVVGDIAVVGEGIYKAEELLEASGISSGMNLYSFRASTVAKNITLRCPYICGVDVNREIPNKVTITVIEDKAMYFAVVFGEYKILSENLRVLETVPSREEVPEGLIKLKLPTLSYSVAGRVVEFANAKRERGIREALSIAMASQIRGKLTMIDLRDPFDVSMVCEGKFKLILGDTSELEYKLKIAGKVLENEMFDTEDKYKIDLTIDGKTGVVPDELIEVE